MLMVLKLSETPGLSVEALEATKATSIVTWATAKSHTMKRHISLVSGTDRKFEETCGFRRQCPAAFSCSVRKTYEISVRVLSALSSL
jgi:hypothetical protein